jgi:hypothetical protein
VYGTGIIESTTTTGTGNLTISQVSGYPRVNDYWPFGGNIPVPYTIIDGSVSPGKVIEEGFGYLTSNANTFVRAFITGTYASGTLTRLGSAASLAAGTKYLLTGLHTSATSPVIMPGKANTVINSSHRYLLPANIYQVQTTGTTSAGTANRGYYFPVKYDFFGKVDAFMVRAGGTVTVDFALFPCDYTNFCPKGPALAAAASSSVSSGIQAFTFSGGAIVLSPGWYFLYVNQGSTSTLTGRRMYAMPQPHFPTGTDATEDPGIIYESATQGTIPTSPAPTNAGIFTGTSAQGNIWPWIALRIST